MAALEFQGPPLNHLVSLPSCYDASVLMLLVSLQRMVFSGFLVALDKKNV